MQSWISGPISKDREYGARTIQLGSRFRVLGIGNQE